MISEDVIHQLDEDVQAACYHLAAACRDMRNLAVFQALLAACASDSDLHARLVARVDEARADWRRLASARQASVR